MDNKNKINTKENNKNNKNKDIYKKYPNLLLDLEDLVVIDINGKETPLKRFYNPV